MTLKNLFENLFCKNKFIILKGSIQGATSNFQKPINNVDSLWNFDLNPIFFPYLFIENSYIIISKYSSESTSTQPLDNPYYNIQILYLFSNKNNLLELGTAVLYDDKLKFNLTETSSVIGEIIYDCKKDIFNLNRFSLPPNNIFIDEGKFNLISPIQFELETGIKI